MGGFLMEENMRRSVEQRSAYRFDPTANQAIARADRKTPKTTDNKPYPYSATPEDIEQYTGVIFEPNRLISNKRLKQLRRKGYL